MPYLLDTNVAVLLREGEPAAVARVRQFRDAWLSVVTVVELEAGVYAKPDEVAVRRARVDALLGAFPVVPFGADAAARYGRIVQVLGYSRRNVLDRMIAATALAVGATVVTANVGDFRGIPGLTVEPW